MTSGKQLVQQLIGPLGPLAAYSSLWRNRGLASRLVLREIQSRYRGSALGLFWSVLTPLLLLAVYTFVFSVVFSMRWGQSVDSRSQFALLLFSGLLIFNLFSECVNRAPSLMLGNPAYIKRVIFPLEILPWVSLCSALFNALISFTILMLGYILVIGLPPTTSMFIPLIILPVVLITAGISLFLASLGVFIRDVQQFVGIVTMILLFMSPIFYPLSAIPEKYRAFAMLSPISVCIEQARDALFSGRTPDFSVWFFHLIGSLLVVWLGHAWFVRTKKGFADVI